MTNWTFIQGMKFRALLEQLRDNPHDVDLLHDDHYDVYPTMADLSIDDFTDAGLERFKTALDMEVVYIQPKGGTWIMVSVKGAPLIHVKEIAQSHAGYCDAGDYDKWFK